MGFMFWRPQPMTNWFWCALFLIYHRICTIVKWSFNVDYVTEVQNLTLRHHRRHFHLHTRPYKHLIQTFNMHWMFGWPDMCKWYASVQMRMSDLAVLNLTFSFAEGLLHCGNELWLTPLVSGVPQKVQSPCQLWLGHLSIDRIYPFHFCLEQSWAQVECIEHSLMWWWQCNSNHDTCRSCMTTPQTYLLICHSC